MEIVNRNSPIEYFTLIEHVDEKISEKMSLNFGLL